LVLPLGVVPTSTLHPCAGGNLFCFCSDASLHIVQRGGADQIHMLHLQPARPEMDVGVIEARHDESALQVDNFCFRASELTNIRTRTRLRDATLAKRKCLWTRISCRGCAA